MEGGRLATVLQIEGRRERHYGLANEKEFFAEMSEAWFGMNDFYPFNRAEVREFDVTLADELHMWWQADVPARPPD